MQQVSVESASSDASFRSYWRVKVDGQAYILMDAPPDKEDSGPFVDIAGRLKRAGSHPPDIHIADLDQGFLLLEDLGNTHLAVKLNEQSAQQWIHKALALLSKMCRKTETEGLSLYTREKLTEELDLFDHWFVQRHLGGKPLGSWWSICSEHLIEQALSQEQVFVHRDFHAENLLIQGDESLAVIDFQDAVLGPITYDLASILMDRHWSWSRQQICDWAEKFRNQLGVSDSARWILWLDWMSLQRNLKIVGIFARLNYRDNKPAYLKLLPRFYQYALDTAQRYSEFDQLAECLREQSKAVSAL